ncbi:MAG: hypothetical protein JXR73_06270 [Candidatus Omnitrophica bacterium]|nr:hypothetical protein [Candidatus Omnitrophota bacterium]
MKTLRLILSIITLSIIFTGCYTTPAQRGAMGGAAIGGIAGQIIGGDTEATLIGAGVGALSGALFNDYVDDQRQQAYRHGYAEGEYYGRGSKHRPITHYYAPRPVRYSPPLPPPPPPPPPSSPYPLPFPIYTHLHFHVD